MITFVSYPLSINRLNITSVYELQILALAASLPDGLKLSNSGLAKLFFTSRQTIINAIKRLQERGFIERTGDDYHRVITITSQVSELLNCQTVLQSDGLTCQNVLQSTCQTLLQKRQTVLPIIKEYNTKENIIALSDYSFILKTGESWNLPQAKLDEYRESFPGVGLDRELRKAAQWLQDNAGKRKTAQGMPRFLGSWLGRVKPEAILTPQANDYDWTPEELDAHLREIGVL